MNIRIIHAGLFVGSFVLAAVAIIGIGGIGHQFRKEGNLVENLSAISFFCVFILSLVLIYRGTSQRVLCLSLALLGLVGYLDEIGFGTRWRGPIELQEVYGIRIDGIHDLFTIAIIWLSADAATYEILALGLGVVVTGYLAVKWGYHQISKWPYLIYSKPEYWFLFLAIMFVIVAFVLDLGLFDVRPLERHILQILEEMLELHAGLALIFSCISVYRRDLVEGMG